MKQKLDSYNLPTIFPFDCVSLLSKLIQKLDQQTKNSHDSITNQIKNSSTAQQSNSIEVNYNFVDKALRS